MAQIEMPSPGIEYAPELGGMRLPGLTVHVVGRLTPPVLSFLLPTMHAMNGAGTRQALLFINNAFGHEQTAGLPPGIHRVPVCDSDFEWTRCGALFRALLKFFKGHSIAALHLHGLLPGIAAMRLSRRGTMRNVDVIFSPHSSRVLVEPTLLHAVVKSALRVGLGSSTQRAIVNSPLEARLMASFTGLSVQMVECSVPQLFFDTPRNEACRPLLISSNMEGGRWAFDNFLRVAVLLNDERLGISFNWVGTAEPDAAAALRAAGIEEFDASTDASRATRFGAAWLYVAASEERGFPIRLAEAMASGLPCVALDTEVHRSMIADGETGYLYGDRRELLLKIGQLIDSPVLRHSLGQAARMAATSRFSNTEFRRQLWRAIGKDPEMMPGTAADDTHLPAPMLKA